MIGDRHERDIQFELANRIVSQKQTLAHAMSDAIAAVKPGVSDQAYRQLNEINFDEALTRSREWLESVFQSEPPSKDVFAFWFGMYDTTQGPSGNEWQQMYISGSDHFDAEDEGDWACDCVWFPNSRYPSVPEMELFGELCPHMENQAAFTLSNSFVGAIAVDHSDIIARMHEPKTGIFGKKSPVEYPIAFGHDSGDCTLVGYATSEGLRSPS
ncbi:MAG: hypothetical protein JJ974_04660 [Phycisphaerales bacterium]|nr:hypothetical protein [Phycisphaerales bacterium]